MGRGCGCTGGLGRAKFGSAWKSLAALYAELALCELELGLVKCEDLVDAIAILQAIIMNEGRGSHTT